MKVTHAAVSLMLVSLPAQGNSQPAEVATVHVDCTSRHQSINRALRRHARADALVVEIEGMCHENVVIRRDRVTLRGADPASDGIEAVTDADQIDAAVWVRGAHLATLENLKLTGGNGGLLMSEASTLWARASNCRFEGNRSFGIALESASHLRVEDSVLSENGYVNAGVYSGSSLQCSDCTLSSALGTNPVLWNVQALAGATVTFANSSLTEGGLLLTNSKANLTDSTIEARLPGPGNQPALRMVDSTATLSRVQVAGDLMIRQGSVLRLSGVEQTRADAGNSAYEGSTLKISTGSDILGFTLGNFSTASLLGDSRISSLSCSHGANAYCDAPTNVSGASNCGLCTVP